MGVGPEEPDHPERGHMSFNMNSCIISSGSAFPASSIPRRFSREYSDTVTSETEFNFQFMFEPCHDLVNLQTL